MSWKPIEATSDLTTILEASEDQPQLIFKHSTRCGISASARFRLEGDLEELAGHYGLNFLDLLNFRALSNQIAEDFGVHHQSPQVIVVNKGETVYNRSHGSIQPSALMDFASTLAS